MVDPHEAEPDEDPAVDAIDGVVGADMFQAQTTSLDEMRSDIDGQGLRESDADPQRLAKCLTVQIGEGALYLERKPAPLRQEADIGIIQRFLDMLYQPEQFPAVDGGIRIAIDSRIDGRM